MRFKGYGTSRFGLMAVCVVAVVLLHSVTVANASPLEWSFEQLLVGNAPTYGGSWTAATTGTVNLESLPGAYSFDPGFNLPAGVLVPMSMTGVLDFDTKVATLTFNDSLPSSNSVTFTVDQSFGVGRNYWDGQITGASWSFANPSQEIFAGFSVSNWVNGEFPRDGAFAARAGSNQTLFLSLSEAGPGAEGSVPLPLAALSGSMLMAAIGLVSRRKRLLST